MHAGGGEARGHGRVHIRPDTSAVGWGWALVLTELVPARADAILQRGREFGYSRVVCNVHWQSDVEAGRTMAAATVARLHADPALRRRSRGGEGPRSPGSDKIPAHWHAAPRRPLRSHNLPQINHPWIVLRDSPDWAQCLKA